MRKEIDSLAYDVNGGLAIDFLPRAAVTLDKSKMSASCTFSTSAIDRVGDMLDVAGIRTENHQSNPVVFWDHARHLTFPIGKTKDLAGAYTVQILDGDQGGVATQVTYFSQTLLEAEQVFELIAEGIISANSIGFRPIKATPLYVGHRRLGLHLKEVELLEISWVGVPCNQDAVRSALSRGRLCGKAIAEPIRQSLAPLVAGRKCWAPGAAIKALTEVPEMGEESERFAVLVDIVGGLLDRPVAKNWNESDHPRGQPSNAGQFGPGGGAGGGGGSKPRGGAGDKPAKKPASPAKKPSKEPAPPSARAGGKQAQQAARQAVAKILSGAITPESHKALVGHLGRLTVPQLQAIRKEHNLKCPGRLKAQVLDALSHHFNSRIIKAGTVDVDKVAAALKPFAAVELDPNTVRFAKADYFAIKQQYGTLAVQRIKELAVDALGAMNELPRGASTEREFFRKRLAVCSWMCDQAKRDGITGRVEPASMTDAKANLARIATAERLKGIPWTAFLLKGIRDEFDVSPEINDEQVWHNLKDPTGSRYKGPRLDAVLTRLRPDYGSMSQSQLFQLLPRLEKRTDTLADAAQRTRPTASLSVKRWRKDVTAGRWDESKHPRADDGKFGAGSGGAAGGDAAKPGGDAPKPAGPRQPAAVRRAMAAVIAIGKQVGHIEHAAQEWIGKKVGSLPAPLRVPIVGVYKIAFASHTVAQKAVAAVAAERGFTPEQIAHVSKICAVVDVVGGGKVFPGVLKATGLGAAALAGSFVPVGSLGYLVFSTGKDPLATLRAAKKGVAAALRVVRPTKAMASTDLINVLLDAAKTADDADLWMATVLAAIDATDGDVARAIEIARVCGRAAARRNWRKGGAGGRWEEGKHPRADDGKFGDKPGAAGANGPVARYSSPDGEKYVIGTQEGGHAGALYAFAADDLSAADDDDDREDVKAVAYFIPESSGMTLLAVDDNHAGRGVGLILSFLFRSEHPFQQSGGLSSGGEAIARRVYRLLRAKAEEQ